MTADEALIKIFENQEIKELVEALNNANINLPTNGMLKVDLYLDRFYDMNQLTSMNLPMIVEYAKYSLTSYYLISMLFSLFYKKNILKLHLIKI